MKVLAAKGYEVKKVRTCDMFPMGGHVESILLLTGKHIKKSDSEIAKNYLDDKDDNVTNR